MGFYMTLVFCSVASATALLQLVLFCPGDVISIPPEFLYACALLKNLGLGVTVFCRLIVRTCAHICSFVFQRIDILISVEIYTLRVPSDSKLYACRNLCVGVSKGYSKK
jgi:hypothetical protein